MASRARAADWGPLLAIALLSIAGQVDQSRRASPAAARRAAEARLAAVEQRKTRLVALLSQAAGRVAGLPEVRESLAGDKASLARVFAQLEGLRAVVPERPALAVHAFPVTVLAWAGRAVDLRSLGATAGGRPDVFVLAGSVTSTLVATAPILDASGRGVGLASAELPVAVRRNIRNEFLSDFDRLADGDGELEIHYLDARFEAAGARPFAPVPGGSQAVEALLRAPDGGVLAAVRALAPEAGDAVRSQGSAHRRAMSGIALALLLVWLATGSGSTGRFVLGTTIMRGALLALGPPWPGPGSPLLDRSVYPSPALGVLAATPLDLLLTAAWLLSFVLALAWRELPRPTARSSHLRAFVACGLGLPVLGLTFAAVADTVERCSLDLETVSLFPLDAPHLVVQVTLLLVLASGVGLLVSLLSLGGALPRGRGPRLVRSAGLLALGIGGYRLLCNHLTGLPAVPFFGLLLACLVLAATRDRWSPRLRAADATIRVGIGLLAGSLLALPLYASLVHFGDADLRRQVEREHAPLVLNQPRWRELVLAESRRRIDALGVMEETSPGPPPLIEELAFAVWSATDLAAYGFSSAIEIQDPEGHLVSRFALNLPSLTATPVPGGPEWETSREDLPLASGGGRVLHSRRLLTYHGVVHGAVHVYVKDDYWNLPFVRGRDPYSVLYRTGGRGSARDRPLALLVYDRRGAVVFSSAERSPVLSQTLLAGLAESAAGFWTVLSVEGRAQHTYLFADEHNVYGLCYPLTGPGHFAADLVEALAGSTLAAVALVLALLLARTLLRRERSTLPWLARSVARRFSLRLFVAMATLAVLPMVVLDLVVRGFVVERLRRETESDALERAEVARKAVEDFVLYRGGEAPGRQPSLEAGLIYVANLLHSDLDLFAQGRLLASSQPELYSSGLLPTRVPGSVYRALALEGQPSVLATERIGSFSYLVVSVPCRLGTSERGILSIPLTLRQRELQAVLADLDRDIRLTSVLFLLLAAGLALSMARRISGPIADLTAATGRIAGGDLSARVDASSRDELAVLVESFNRMAGDLDRQRHDLEHSNRLAAWAEMARQVAHEVKNPLTPIQLSAEHLRRVWADSSEDFGRTLASCTETILGQVRILRGIATEFSAYARPPAPVLEPLELWAVIQAVLAPYRSALRAGIRLGLEAPGQSPVVWADRRLLERAVVNLVENALQAVGEAGSVSVRSRAGPDRVEVEVEDSGPGIDPELRDKVFEPFFSTKTGGSGLGLALVKKIAEDHGGGVALDGAPGRTRVSFWLPTAPQPERAADPSRRRG